MYAFNGCIHYFFTYFLHFSKKCSLLVIINLFFLIKLSKFWENCVSVLSRKMNEKKKEQTVKLP